MEPSKSIKGAGSSRLILFCVYLILLVVASASKENEESSIKTSEGDRMKNLDVKASPYSQRSEKIKASREQWERAFKEIKAFRLTKKEGSIRNKGFFSQWKLLLDEPSKVELDLETNLTTSKMKSTLVEAKMSRFEGFASWERTLQEWSDDVQEYLEKVGVENSEYPMSTYGTPYSQIASEAESLQSKAKDADTIEIQSPLNEEVTKLDNISVNQSIRINLPVPAPRKDAEEILPHTNVADRSKNIWIVTTAALPWMTGTAVNPLLRAAYMTDGRSEAGGSVTLMLPWLERRKDQKAVYGEDSVFKSPEEQEDYIRTWLKDKAELPEASQKLKIDWYTAWQNQAENSLYSMGDITALIPKEEVDVCILEEPEHLNWYRAPGDSWTNKFKHVVGIIHTNYFVYAQEQPAAFIRAPGMRLLCSWMCRAHCHRVIKLSGTLGQFAPEKELVENVHGVRFSFLDAGEQVRERLMSDPVEDSVFGANAEPKVYFIGKMLWSKGLGSLMELLKYAEESAGTKVHIDMYGGGPDKDEASAKAELLDVDMEFHGPIDHADLALTHKLFINPSTSEVLCTTVAEALAMGKFVLVPSHPSNDFFAQFPNCLTYTNKEEFVGNLYYALTHSPEPLAEEDSYALSWEAATERLEAAAAIPVKEAELMSEALSSEKAGIEISLPPFIDDHMGRKLVASTLIRSRSRYRQFRQRLSQEIQQSDGVVKGRLVSELEKRLDLDIDDILESPKLRLQISPAELDKQLLKLYNQVADGPSGDVLRIIGGGQEVAFQDLYLKRSSAKKRRNVASKSIYISFGPFESLSDDDDEESRTASQWVKQALRKNLQSDSSIPTSNTNQSSSSREDNDFKMTSQLPFLRCNSLSFFPQVITAKQFCPPRKSSLSFSVLI